MKKTMLDFIKAEWNKLHKIEKITKALKNFL